MCAGKRLFEQSRYEHLKGEGVVSLHTGNSKSVHLLDGMGSHIHSDFIDTVNE